MMGRGRHRSQQVPRRADQGTKFPEPHTRITTSLPRSKGSLGSRDGQATESRFVE